MQYDLTDREQKDQVKKWLRDYGWSTALAIAIGLAGSYGWRTWQEHKAIAATNASNLYAAMQVMAATGNADKLQQYSQQLVAKYKDSTYAALGQLLQAKQQSSKQHYAAAKVSLDWVLSNSKQQVLRDMAYLSLSSLMLQESKAHSALQYLNKVSVAYAPIVWQQKAITYQQLQQPKQALAALSKAQALYIKDGLQSPLVDLMLAQYPLPKTKVDEK